jgi:NADP-dependent 3-hydroxy acid dehydrogenase YdfG
LAQDHFGKLDVLVGNAGVSRVAPLDDLDVAGWEEMIDINLKGFLYGIAAALPVFRQQGFGHFVTVISTSGLRIVPNQAVYAATKNAVRTICEGLRQEAGAKLRVTGVSPGFVKTELADSVTNPALRAQIREKMDEIAIAPEAIARAIAFAIEQPADVDVGDLVVRPTAQTKSTIERSEESPSARTFVAAGKRSRTASRRMPCDGATGLAALVKAPFLQ